MPLRGHYKLEIGDKIMSMSEVYKYNSEVNFANHMLGEFEKSFKEGRIDLKEYVKVTLSWKRKRMNASVSARVHNEYK